MATFIDRRDTYKDRSSGSRQRFLRRYKKHIRDAVRKSINDSKGITDIVNDKPTNISIDDHEIEEPIFVHGEGGAQDHIIVGNTKFVVGDRIPKPRPESGSGSGNRAAQEGEGDDEFNFYVSQKEFIDILFDDLELPDLVKQSLLNTNVRELVADGFTRQGTPSQMDVVRSYTNSLSRRIGLHRKRYKRELIELEAALVNAPEDEKPTIRARMEFLRKKLKAIPFFDDIDLRYRHSDYQVRPTTSAVMFALMDVSGSMGEHEKSVSKLFFFLLFLFLKKNYDNVQIVFIRHTHEAVEVSEEEFFNSKQTGGTIVSTALDLCKSIIQERYDPSAWNIYIAQASDGDNDDSDIDACQTILENHLLSVVQYMVYVQIRREQQGGMFSTYVNSSSEPDNNLWELYKDIKKENANFDMKVITDQSDIYPVFRKLFEKKDA